VTHSSYAAATAAAEVAAAFYARHTTSADRGGAGARDIPDAAAIAAIVDAAFWASLRQEEGRFPRISLAYLSPDRAGRPAMFARSLALATEPLTRLAPAVERPGVHLGVWPEEGELRVWGATRTLPDLCLVLEVVEPGLLVLKYSRGDEYGKFGNIAVLRGDRVRVIDDRCASLTNGPPLLVALLDLEAQDSWADDANGFVQIAVSMRRHARGGSLLIVPDRSARWRESIIQPISYEIAPPFTRLAELLRLPLGERGRAGGRDGVPRLVDMIAGFTAVDGAAVMTDEYDLLAFGAKIGRREGMGAAEQVVVTEPVLDDVPTIVATTQLGGTRHLSAAQFVHDQHDALALVASQDGRFTAFAWSPSEQRVHAHRIETLLF
jgi:hypothetical protein